MNINELITAYLNCPYKLYLKNQSKKGQDNYYIEYYANLYNRIKSDTLDDIYHKNKRISENVEINSGTIASNDYILNGMFNHSDFKFYFDIIEIKHNSLEKRDDIIPVLIYEKEAVSKIQKLLITIKSVKAEEILNIKIDRGKIINGYQNKHSIIKLNNYKKEAKGIWQDIHKIINNEFTPPLQRNRHCKICEYDIICKQYAIENDSLSLLSGIAPKEIKKWNDKGIFTIKQLSYNFRPRRRRKQNKNLPRKNKFELKAKAISDNKIYVYETPEKFKKTDVEIYWDVEGIPEIKSYYLIGVLIVENSKVNKYQFWAENKEEEIDVFYKFLGVVGPFKDNNIFHYGNYEIQYLKYMRLKTEQLEHKSLIDGIIEKSINLLTYFNHYLYLPVYSNGLKEIGNYLGLKWSDGNITGINSIAVRKEWEFTRIEVLKNKLVQYNYEDCLNLTSVKAFINRVIENKEQNDNFPFQIEYEKANEQNTTFAISNGIFADPNFELINNSSYFDYQSEKVKIRESDNRKKRKVHNKKNSSLTNRKIIIEKTKCIYCLRKTIGKIDGPKTKKVLDIKFTKSGVKKWTIKYVSYEYYCSNCMMTFIPREYSKIKEHYGHSLKSWVIYQHYVNLLSFEKIIINLDDLFKINLTKASAHAFKESFKNYYKQTYEKLILKILESPVVYIDETPFKLLSGEIYAWVFTNGQEVVSLFRRTRTGDFLKDMFKNFKGVLVSDFYSAYNSLDCTQQKCLIHLIRDFNDDLLKKPFDDELKQITNQFTILLKKIVKMIDKKGFNKSYLIQFMPDVNAFYDFVDNKDFHSEVANKYQERIRKNKDKLFTFIEFDNVAWNNTFAEHAIKLMAVHRNKNIKFFKESRLEDYLLIMSLYQTSKYKGFNFLEFLLSQEVDIDLFCKQNIKMSRNTEG